MKTKNIIQPSMAKVKAINSYTTVETSLLKFLKEIRTHAIQCDNAYDRNLTKIETLEILSYISMKTIMSDSQSFRSCNEYLADKLYGCRKFKRYVEESLRVLAKFWLISVDRSQKMQIGNLTVNQIQTIHINPYLKQISLNNMTKEKMEDIALTCAWVAESRCDGEQGINATYRFGDAEKKDNIIKLLTGLPEDFSSSI